MFQSTSTAGAAPARRTVPRRRLASRWLAVLLFATETCLACQCLGDLEHSFRGTDRLFVARVLAAETFRGGYRIAFEPLERLKGDFPDRRLYSQPRFTCGMRYVTVGRHYVFFVSEKEIGDEPYFVASCWSFAIDGAESREKLKRLRAWAPQNAIPTLARRPECDELERQGRLLNQLTARYTKQHPDVIAVREKIKQLRLALYAQFVPGRTLCYEPGRD